MSRRDEMLAFYAEQGWMVRLLADGEAHRCGDLARALGIGPDGVAHLVERLRGRFGRTVIRSDRRWGYWLGRPLRRGL